MNKYMHKYMKNHQQHSNERVITTLRKVKLHIEIISFNTYFADTHARSVSGCLSCLIGTLPTVCIL